MLEDDVLKMIVRGTRGGARKRSASKTRKSTSKTRKAPVRRRKTTGSKTAKKPARKGVAKSGYMAHVKKYQRLHPSLSWKQCMIKARSSYKPKGSARAGTMAGSKRSFRQTASKVNKTLRDKKAISKTLRALSAIPTPLSGYAQDAALVASALGYGRQRR